MITLPIRLVDISFDPDQPRKEVDPEAIQRLADTIRQFGLMQPITVRPHPQYQPRMMYQIVSGERRYRAHVLLGKETIMAHIDYDSHGDVLPMQIIENVAREDLNPMEKAHGFQRLMEAGFTSVQLSSMLGVTMNHLQTHLLLLHTVDNVQHLVQKGQMSVPIASKLGELNANSQRRALRTITSKQLSNYEARLLCDRLRSEEMQADMFPETVISDESRGIVRDFRSWVEQFSSLMRKLNVLEEKEAGSIGAALSADGFLVKAQIAEIKKNLNAIERAIDSHSVATLDV